MTRRRRSSRGVLAEDPLDSTAIVEKALQGDPSQLDLLRDDAQEYLEAASAYAEMNLWDDAAAALRLCEGKAAGKHPFVLFHLGYLADRKGDRDAAKDYYQRGLRIAPDYVFPSRVEDLAVLETGLRYAPDDWKLNYYLGVLLTASMRWQEGLEHFQAAEKASPEFAVLYWCLGEIYRQKLGEPARAQAAYERALKCNPNDCAYYIALDQLYGGAEAE